MVDSDTEGRIDGYVPFPHDRVEDYRSAGHWLDLTFHEVLDRAGSRSPEKPFVVGPHGVRTYGEVIERSKRIAGFLLGELGLEPLDRIAIQLTNREEFLELFFGCSRAGVIPVIVLPRHRRAEATHVVELTDARAFVTLGSGAGGGFDFIGMVDEVAAATESLVARVAVGADGSVPAEWIEHETMVETDWTTRHGDAVASVVVEPTDPGVMLLSGGTTGMPKGIPRTHNDYVFQWSRWEDVVGVRASWTLMPWVPIGHNASLNPIVGGAAWSGATIAVEPQLKPGPLLDRTVEADVDFFFAVPAQLVDLLERDGEKEYDLGGVSAVISGGQKVRPKTVRELNDRWDIGVANIFGMAEGPLICTRPDDEVAVQAETVGRPVAPEADEFRIVDETRTSEVPPGAPGELAARGAGVFPGYFRNPGENEENFDGDGWFYTEDVLERGDDGNFRVHGRLKDTIIRGGENIYAPGVEDELIEHPAIKNVAVIGMPDERLGERPMAYVELEDGAGPLELSELSDFLNARGVAVFKRPERLEVVESLPRTEVGKISKATLTERITERLKTEGELPADY